MRPRLALALLVGLALVVVALAARGESPVTYTPRDVGPGDAQVRVQPTRTDVAESEQGSVVGGSLVVVLVVLIGMALIVLVGVLTSLRAPKRRRRAQRVVVEPGEDGRLDAPEQLVRGAREALAGLVAHTGGPPRDAVVAAWLRLERAAADSGTARQPHQTPTEFTGELLARYAVDEAATGALRRVYQRARFGAAEVTDEDARTAREALERVVRDLAVGAR